MNSKNTKACTPPFAVFLNGNNVLVYDASVAHSLLTEYRIISKLIGASSFYQTQNKFNVLPLLLNVDSVTLGLEKGILKLYEDPFIYGNPDNIIANKKRDSHQIGMKSKLVKDKKCVDISNRWKYPQTKQEKEKYFIFRDLYEKGYYITPALKFGADYLIYESSPLMMHAKYMVYVIDWEKRLKPPIIASFTRLALSVRKKILLGSCDRNKAKFLVLNYFSTKKKDKKSESNFDKEAMFSEL